MRPRMRGNPGPDGGLSGCDIAQSCGLFFSRLMKTQNMIETMYVEQHVG